MQQREGHHRRKWILRGALHHQALIGSSLGLNRREAIFSTLICHCEIRRSEAISTTPWVIASPGGGEAILRISKQMQELPHATQVKHVRRIAVGALLAVVRKAVDVIECFLIRMRACHGVEL